MALLLLPGLMFVSILAQSPPASQPSTPLLSGPSATSADAGKLTLVQRSFDGRVESVGPQPDVLAIGMLDLTPDQRARFDEINSARLAAFDNIIRSNYGLVLELASLQGETNQQHRNHVLGSFIAAIKPYTDRGTFYQEMWPHLTDAQRQQTQTMLTEYRDARRDSMQLEVGAGATPASIAARDRLETFGQMVRESIERQVGLERDEFDALASELALTSEQRNATEAIFQPLAIKRFQKIEVTKGEQTAAFAEFNKLLTAGQKQKLLGILLKRYQDPAGGAAASKPATPATAPAAGPAPAPSPPQNSAYKLETGPFGVTQRLLTLTDAPRNRDVPIKAYLPKRDRPAADPVIIFSPGWGGSRDGYAYLAQHWASHGNATFVLEHDGSDLDFARAAVGEGGATAGVGAVRLAQALRQSLNDSSNWINRALDVTFTLDELNRRNGQTGDEFFGRLDLSRVGMAGHSFGAYTAMLIMGALVDMPGEADRGLRDSRCVAGIAMSSQRDGQVGLDAHSWDNVTAPMLYFTGTKDYELIERDATGRRVGFDRTPADKADQQMLITIKDAEHMAFSDNNRGFGGEAIQRNPNHHQWILMETTAFWDAHLRNDAAAEVWLRSDALATLSKGECVVERK